MHSVGQNADGGGECQQSHSLRYVHSRPFYIEERKKYLFLVLGTDGLYFVLAIWTFVSTFTPRTQAVAELLSCCDSISVSWPLTPLAQLALHLQGNNPDQSICMKRVSLSFSRLSEVKNVVKEKFILATADSSGRGGSLTLATPVNSTLMSQNCCTV